MIRSEERDGHLVVRIDHQRFDAAFVPTFRAEMERLLAAGHRHLVLDLAAVEFMDSSGLGALVAVLKRLGDPARLPVCGVRGPVAKLIRLTHLDKVLRLHDDVAHALSFSD
ncbi:STAS domain-containing protein [Benzoatithermus flavus]|uniref:Anti-sigma factor antagonist n=1 Tax=Benzoatithermus flavus TaxID=3108223 RepID=A0ABU8XSD2_9PROT